MVSGGTFIERLNLNHVKSHYLARQGLGRRMRELLDAGDSEQYAKLALGISDPVGNYSSHEHGLGERILSGRSHRTIFDLGIRLNQSTKPSEMLRSIYDAGIPHLKISVGSEMAMLLMPANFWVANVRTVWTHLLVKQV